MFASAIANIAPSLSTHAIFVTGQSIFRNKTWWTILLWCVIYDANLWHVPAIRASSRIIFPQLWPYEDQYFTIFFLTLGQIFKGRYNIGNYQVNQINYQKRLVYNHPDIPSEVTLGSRERKKELDFQKAKSQTWISKKSQTGTFLWKM